MKDMLLSFKGILPDEVVVRLQEELTVTEDIDTEVDRAAHMFGFYAVLSEKAESRYAQLKYKYDSWLSDQKAGMRKTREAKSMRALKESDIMGEIRRLPKYHSYQKVLLEYEREKGILKALAKAFEIKCNLVQTKAANRRSESR